MLRTLNVFPVCVKYGCRIAEISKQSHDTNIDWLGIQWSSVSKDFKNQLLLTCNIKQVNLWAILLSINTIISSNTHQGNVTV